MVKYNPIKLMILLVVVLLAGCAQPLSVSTPASPTANSVPTAPASATAVAISSSPTPLLTSPTPALSATTVPILSSPTPPPVSSPTEPPSATPSGPTIAHFASGQAFAITSIHMLDASTGWAIGGLVGVGDHILRTDDGGNTWQDLTPPEPQPDQTSRKQASAFFMDASQAWVTYNNLDAMPPASSVVWHTQDGGKTWQASQPLDLSGLQETYVVSDLQFADAQNGWMLAHVGVGMNHDYVALYRSQDGGLSWTRLIDPYNDGGIQSCSKTAMLFTDAQNGWLTIDCNGVMAGAILDHSKDGGATWERVNLPSPQAAPALFDDPEVACGVMDPVFFSAESGKVAVKCTHFAKDPITYDYYLFSTQDGGASWTSTTYPGETVIFLNPQVGWAQNQDIYQTTDSGATWTKVASPIWHASFDFISDQMGWGVARYGDMLALVQTSNGGGKWAELKPVIAP